MKTAVILGITGQDGSYLTELLLRKDYIVHGVVRRSSQFNRRRIEHLISDPAFYGRRLFLHYCDLLDATPLRRLILKLQPDEIYHLAGQSHPGLSFEIPESTFEEVARATIGLLEICRDLEPTPRLYHASSSEIFGAATESPQTECSPHQPVSPYGAAKSVSTQMCRIYREAYGLFVCNGIAYNHESIRRGENFVTMKICREVAKIKKGLSDGFALGNLEARRDWGYAPDYVEAMWRALQQDGADDYILATGETHSVEDFLAEAFRVVGITREGRVRQDPRFMRPVEPVQLVGNPGRAADRLGWKPKKSFAAMVEEMVQAELDRLG